MVVVMAADASASDVDHVVGVVRDAGGEAFVSRGESRTIIGLSGDIERFAATLNLAGLPGVANVVRISVPYKLVSREHRRERSVIRVAGVPIGPDTLTVIAGPCAVETPEQTLAAARMARAAGASLLRGGAFKPRTSPYAFQGLGEAGLKILAEVREETGLPIVTEVIDQRDVELVSNYADMLQVGTRNMQNFPLLQAVGAAGKPVMLKRGFSATIEEWLMAAEYIAQRGNLDIVLCERGIRTFENATRNTLDISAVPVAQRLSHLPVIVDPSHSGGRRDLVLPLSRAAIAVGADGIMVDVHPSPETALCDGPQALIESDLRELASVAHHLSPLVGRVLVEGAMAKTAILSGANPALSPRGRPPVPPDVRRCAPHAWRGYWEPLLLAVFLGARGQRVGQFVHVEAALDLAQVLDLGPGLRPARQEQRAAVLVGQLGDRQRAQPPRLGHDLGLVPADQRPQDGQANGVVERGDVGQRLAGHLAEGVAGDQRAGVQPGRERFGRPEHQPPLRHYLEPARSRGGEGLLRLAERHHVQPGAALEPVEPAHQRVGLVDRLGPGQRQAGKVQEHAAQPALHHPVRGYRRVDAAGQQHDRAAAHPDRQPALPRLPAGEHEHLLGVDLDEDLRLRVLERNR
jgi:3-deoxy-7-phosphoheptulonate synthase